MEDVNSVLTSTTGTLHTTLDNLQTMSSDLKNLAANPEGLATTLLDPKGTVASLLDDNDKLYFQIQDILGNINSSIAQLQNFTSYLNDTQPQITGILEDGQEALDKGKDVLEGLSNNPLLRGGITQEAEQPTTFQGYRDEDF